MCIFVAPNLNLQGIKQLLDKQGQHGRKIILRKLCKIDVKLHKNIRGHCVFADIYYFNAVGNHIGKTRSKSTLIKKNIESFVVGGGFNFNKMIFQRADQH